MIHTRTGQEQEGAMEQDAYTNVVQQEEQQRTTTMRGQRRRRPRAPVLLVTTVAAVLLSRLQASEAFFIASLSFAPPSRLSLPQSQHPRLLPLAPSQQDQHHPLPPLTVAGGRSGNNNPDESQQLPPRFSCTRRDSLCRNLLLLGLAGSAVLPQPAAAATGRVKGAAELDAEAYIKDLLKGNPLQGAIEASPLSVRPARTLDTAFARFLDAITVDGIAEVAGLPRAQVEAEVNKLQRAVEPSFQRRATFPSQDLSNEYAFDCRSYVEFRVAAKLIPNLNARATFVQGLGARVLDKIMAEVGKPGSNTNLRVYDANADGLEAGALDGLRAIMAFMRAKAFIRDYTLETDDYDRQSWDEGYTLELQASVFEPATLGGNAQFTAEGFLFHPDYIGETLLEYLRRCGVQSPKYLQYLLDEEYRPNPKDYQPTEILYQLVVERAKK